MSLRSVHEVSLTEVRDYYNSQFPWRFFLRDEEQKVATRLLQEHVLPLDPMAQEALHCGNGGMSPLDLSSSAFAILPSMNPLESDQISRRLRGILRRRRLLRQRAHEAVEEMRKLSSSTPEFHAQVVVLRGVLMAMGMIVAEYGVLLASSRFSGAVEYLLFGLLRRHDPCFHEYAIPLCSFLKMVPMDPEEVLRRGDLGGSDEELSVKVRTDHMNPYDSSRVQAGVYLPHGHRVGFCVVHRVPEVMDFLREARHHLEQVRNLSPDDGHATNLLKDAIRSVTTLVGMRLEHQSSSLDASAREDVFSACQALLEQVDNEVTRHVWVDDQRVLWEQWLPVLRYVLETS